MQITKVIKEHGFTIEQVASQLKNSAGYPISRSTLAKTVIKSNVETDTLRKIANVIGADMVEFFADEERKNKPKEPASSRFVCPHCGTSLIVTEDQEPHRV